MELKDFMNKISKESNEDSIEPHYDRIGDSIILFFDRMTVTYGERIGSLITIYKSRDDDSLAGFEIKGVRTIIKEFFVDEYEVLFENAHRKCFRRIGDFLKLVFSEKEPHRTNNSLQDVIRY